MKKILVPVLMMLPLMSGCVSNDSRGQRAIEDANIIEISPGLYKGTHSNFISNDTALSTAEMMAVKHCKNMGVEGQIEEKLLRGDVVHIAWTCFTQAYYTKVRKEKEIARKKAEVVRIARGKAEAERITREKAEAERIAREKVEAERIEAEIWDVESKLISRGSLEGYRSLKFGLNLREAKKILDSNCSVVKHKSTNSNTGYKLIEGSSCFDVSGRKIARLFLEFSNYRISSITLDFNGNSTFPEGTNLLELGLFAAFGGLDNGEFDSSVLQNILSTISSKYDLYSTTTMGVWDRYAFEQGALTVEIASEFIMDFNKVRDYMKIQYISNDQEIKSNLNELGLSYITKDEF